MSTVKALVALTAVPEDVLQTQLKKSQAQAAQSAMMGVSKVPAHVLAQRPDVYAAQREVAAASADVGAAQAARYPRLVLTGSVGSASSRSALRDADTSTWSIGPLSLTLPLVDGGRRSASQAAAQARYDEAAALYRATARQAVREVEESLLTLHSTESRMADARRASAGYASALQARERATVPVRSTCWTWRTPGAPRWLPDRPGMRWNWSARRPGWVCTAPWAAAGVLTQSR